MSWLQLQAALGLPLLCLLAWACGGCRPGVRPRVVVAGLLSQLVIAGALLHVPPLRAGFAAVGDAVDALARATRAGTSLVFGYLGGGPLPFAELAPGGSFILFFQALPLVLLVGCALGGVVPLADHAVGGERAGRRAETPVRPFRRLQPLGRGQCLRRHGRGRRC